MSFGKPLDDPSAPKTGISGRAPSIGGAWDGWDPACHRNGSIDIY